MVNISRITKKSPSCMSAGVSLKMREFDGRWPESLQVAGRILKVTFDPIKDRGHVSGPIARRVAN